MPNASAWFYSQSFNGRIPAPPPVYCAPCGIDHDTPEQCPEHDDYEPVRGLDRYPDVNVSDLAEND